MRIRNMQVNHLTDPLGYACEYPVLFLGDRKMSEGKCQEKVRMEIALDRAMKKVSLRQRMAAGDRQLRFLSECTDQPQDQILLAGEGTYGQERKGCKPCGLV